MTTISRQILDLHRSAGRSMQLNLRKDRRPIIRPPVYSISWGASLRTAATLKSKVLPCTVMPKNGNWLGNSASGSSKPISRNAALRYKRKSSSGNELPSTRESRGCSGMRSRAWNEVLSVSVPPAGDQEPAQVTVGLAEVGGTLPGRPGIGKAAGPRSDLMYCKMFTADRGHRSTRVLCSKPPAGRGRREAFISIRQYNSPYIWTEPALAASKTRFHVQEQRFIYPILACRAPFLGLAVGRSPCGRPPVAEACFSWRRPPSPPHRPGPVDDIFSPSMHSNFERC
jgi:hypothetical protein